MPRITVAGGPSNPHAQPGEAGYIEPADPGAWEWRGEHGPELVELPAPADVLPEGWTADPGPAAGRLADAPDYGLMTQAALRDEAKTRGLPSGGSKAELAARLSEHDTAQAGDA